MDHRTARREARKEVQSRQELVYRVWTSIRGVQPFFPIYSHRSVVALSNHLFVDRHTRILEQFADENPVIYLSVYYVNDSYRDTVHVDPDFSRKLKAILDDGNSKLADFDSLTNTLRKDAFHFSRGKLFHNSRFPPKIAEIARFVVNYPNLRDFMVRHKWKTGQSAHEEITTQGHLYLTPIKMGISLAAMPSVSASPSLILDQQNESPKIGLNYLESMPSEIVYKIAFELDSIDLEKICSVSQRLSTMFCGEESSWFWISKLKQDADFQNVDAATLRRNYFDQERTARVTAFLNGYKLTGPGIEVRLWILMFLTGIINQDNVHPYPFDQLLTDIVEADIAPRGIVGEQFGIQKDSEGRAYPVYTGDSEYNWITKSRIEVRRLFNNHILAVLDRYFPMANQYRFTYSGMFFAPKEARLKPLFDNVFLKTFLTKLASSYWIDQNRINDALEAIHQIIVREPDPRFERWGAQLARAGDEGGQ